MPGLELAQVSHTNSLNVGYGCFPITPTLHPPLQGCLAEPRTPDGLAFVLTAPLANAEDDKLSRTDRANTHFDVQPSQDHRVGSV